MHPSIERLLKVQEVDSQLIFLEEAARSRPQELSDERRRLEGAQGRVDGIRAEIKEARMAADAREVDIKRFDQEIDKITVAQNQAKTNEEYTIYKEQIRRQNSLRSEAEEEVLAKLDVINDLQKQQNELEEQLSYAQKSFDRKEKEVAEVVGGLNKQLDELRGKREGLLDGIDKDHLTIYGRVLGRHKDFAIARVEDKICRGCHMQVTPQEVNRLLQNGLLQCRNCSRLLYLDT